MNRTERVGGTDGVDTRAIDYDYEHDYEHEHEGA